MAYDSTLLRLPDQYTTPAGPGFVSVSLTNNNPGTVHELNTGTVKTVKFNGSYWTLAVTMPEMFPSEAANIIPFLHSIAGGFEDFYIQLPQYRNPVTGAWNMSNSTLTAAGAITIGTRADTIIISNWSTRGGDISTGDMIKFSNSHKIYLVVATSLVANTKTIRLNCDILQPSLIPTAALEPNDIKFRVRYLGNITPELTSRGVYSSISLNLRENIL